MNASELIAATLICRAAEDENIRSRVHTLGDAIQIVGQGDHTVALVRERDVVEAFNLLDRQGVAMSYVSDRAKPRIRFLHDQLLDLYRVEIENRESTIHMVRFLGHGWVHEVLESFDPSAAVEAGADQVPDAWTPLPIDRTTEAYADVITSSEAALREIEENNGYAATQPEERSAIVEAIRNTLRSVKDGLPTRSQIISGLLAPLKYISRKFADASMGELAKKAVIAILNWLSELL